MPINFFTHLASRNSDYLLEIATPEHLRGAIEGIYVFKGGQITNKALLFNDGYPLIAFMESPKASASVNLNGEVKFISNIWGCGGMLKHVYCQDNIDFENCLVIRFYTPAFLKIFEVDTCYFANAQVFNLRDIADISFNNLEHRYYACDSLTKKVDLITSYLSATAVCYESSNAFTDIGHLIESRNPQTVKELLDSCTGAQNYKWLERTFRKHLGMSPQNYLAIKRFLKAYISLDSSAGENLLPIAIANGYYDANHLVKDFKRFCGMPPKAFFNQIKKAQ